MKISSQMALAVPEHHGFTLPRAIPPDIPPKKITLGENLVFCRILNPKIRKQRRWGTAATGFAEVSNSHPQWKFCLNIGLVQSDEHIT
jgi:hypothetical protein